MERKHSIRHHPCEGFTNDWAIVAAELKSQSSTNLPQWTAPQSPTPINLRVEALVDNQNHSQTTDVSFDLGTSSASGLLRYLDSDPSSSNNSPEKTVRLMSDSRVSSTRSYQISLSLEILEPELQETVHRDPGTEEEGNRACV